MARILVADDDEVMLGLIRTLMELEGIEVITVTRPESIVPIAESEELSLILMDYHLAGGNSITALKELKNDAILKKIPVLVTSGMDREYECLTAGAEGFLLKPFRPTNLLDQINKLTKKQEA